VVEEQSIINSKKNLNLDGNKQKPILSFKSIINSKKNFNLDGNKQKPVLSFKKDDIELLL
jgi:hypothetical protein